MDLLLSDSLGILLVLVIALAARAWLFALVRQPVPSLKITGEKTELTPAESAFLLRGGDMSHTIVVTVVDLVLRSVKSGDPGKIELHSYEQEIFGTVQKFIKQWAQGKISEIVPIPVHDMKNPVQWLIRLRALKTFFSETLRQFFRDFVKDPLHIRRYFSFTGIARLALDLYSSGPRAGVEGNLKQGLLAHGLLVAESKRVQYAKLMCLLVPLPLIGCAATYWLIFDSIRGETVSVGPMLETLFLPAIAAVLIYALIQLPHLSPSISEFVRVAGEIPRQGFRFTIVRGILSVSRTIIWMLAIIFLLLTATTLNATITVQPPFILNNSWIEYTILTGTLILAWLLTFQLVKDALELFNTELPTATAQHKLAAMKERLGKMSPIKTLSGVFTQPEYDQSFPEIVAIYGIETLWLLS